MDLKEQIIKFLNEETSQVRTLDGEGFAITLDNYKEDTEYLANELIKLFSSHKDNKSICECCNENEAKVTVKLCHDCEEHKLNLYDF